MKSEYLMMLGVIQCFEDHGNHAMRSQMHAETGHGALCRQADYTRKTNNVVSVFESSDTYGMCE